MENDLLFSTLIGQVTLCQGFSLFILFSSISSTFFFCWVSIMPKQKDCKTFSALSIGRREASLVWQRGAEGKILQPARRGSTLSKRGRSLSQEGQLSSFRQAVQRVAVFSAPIHITVTTLSPNTVLLLSKTSEQVLKASCLCPKRRV